MANNLSEQTIQPIIFYPIYLSLFYLRYTPSEYLFGTESEVQLIRPLPLHSVVAPTLFSLGHPSRACESCRKTSVPTPVSERRSLPPRKYTEWPACKRLIFQSRPEFCFWALKIGSLSIFVPVYHKTSNRYKLR